MTLTQEQRVVSVESAGKALGIGRSAAYEAVRRGDIPGVIRLGRRIVISVQALDRLLAEGNQPVGAAHDGASDGEPDASGR